MSIQLKPLHIISFIILFITSQNSFGDFNPGKNINRNYTDIIVGSKTDATSGVVTISNSDIQQLIISTIPDLSAMTITNEQPFISVSDAYSYLIFRVTTSSSDTISVAVRLTISSTQFSFQPHTNKDVHICKGYGSCTSCTFMFGISKNITGCFIKKFRKGEELNYGGCNHTLTTAQ